MEIICVDDGSTDGSGAILEEFANTSVCGKLIANDLSVALSSLDSEPRVAFNNDAIITRREFSRKWLQTNLTRKA